MYNRMKKKGIVVVSEYYYLFQSIRGNIFHSFFYPDSLLIF